MKGILLLALSATALLFTSCERKKQDDGVVSERYIHKYGYAVSKDEFETRQYPGQVVTLLKNGVTITATYENGVLHGPCTHTFPHSQTVENYYLYNQGSLVKETTYDVSGMPMREEVQLSPNRHATTLWFVDGTPMSMEEYTSDELIDGQYYTTKNEREAQVIKGKGMRIGRDAKGILLFRDQINEGYIAKRETFYPTGDPESIAFYLRGVLNGEKKTFAISGEPLSTKEYINGKLHGKSTFYKNGNRYLEVSYLDGMKNGLEVHYLDGEVVSQEIPWENDHRHGPSKYYLDGIAKTEFYYEGELVSPEKWQELSHLDEVISQISPAVSWR